MDSSNPEIIVIPYKINNDITVNVIRDDLTGFPGGTKERALIKYIKNHDQYSEFVYVGPSSGFAQIALTDACVKLKKRATLFLINPPNYEPYLSLWCERMGANVKYFSGKISDVEKTAEEYVRVKRGKAFLIPFGLDDPEYSNILLSQLQQAIPLTVEPKRLWLTVGSGTLLRVLAEIWPRTEFFPVRVGKDLYSDKYKPEVWERMGGEERIIKLTAPQKFFERVPTDLLPPYPSVANYDAKVWQQVLKYAQNGDYIWNVAAEDNVLTADHKFYYIKASDYLPPKPTDKDYLQTARELIPRVKNGEIWFPYQKYFMQSPQVLFDNLKQNHLEILHPKEYELRSYFPKFKSYLINTSKLVDKNGRKVKKVISYALFRDQPTTVVGLQGEYNTIDVITDYFVEEIRLKTKRYDQEYSVIDSWGIDSYLETIFTIALKAGDITPKTLRSAIYYAIQEAGTFQPSKARGLLEAVMGRNLVGKRWLDISAGWGDRLIAAMSLDMIYTGYDPNIELKKGHDEMIAMFGSPDKQKVIYQPFEKAEIEDMYDVILTSPPFFDVEDYAQGQEGQSIVSYPDFTKWTVHFLFASLLKAWDHLSEGGYLILHLADANNQKDASRSLNICETTMIFIENYLVGASWEGILALSGESGYFRPTFCVQKIGRYDKPKRWVGKINYNDRKLYHIPRSWIDDNRSIPRTLYFTYPEVQKEVLRYYAQQYLPAGIINKNNLDLNPFYQRIIESFQQIEKELIYDLFVGVEEISSLIEILGLDNTVKWGTAMIKLALCDNINNKC